MGARCERLPLIRLGLTGMAGSCGTVACDSVRMETGAPPAGAASTHLRRWGRHQVPNAFGAGWEACRVTPKGVAYAMFRLQVPHGRR